MAENKQTQKELPDLYQAPAAFCDHFNVSVGDGVTRISFLENNHLRISLVMSVGNARQLVGLLTRLLAENEKKQILT